MLNRLSQLGCLALCLLWVREANAHEIIQGKIATVSIEAEVVEAPCNIELSSRDQAVELPPVATNALKRPGDHSAVTWFSIVLRGCMAQGGQLEDSSLLSNTWSSDGTILAVRFNGTRDDQNPNLLSTKGSSTGVAIRLVDTHERPIVPGVFNTPIIAKAAMNKIIYGAEVIRTTSALTPGDYRAVVNFVIKYE